MSRPLLMPRQNMLHTILLVQRIVDMQCRPAGIAKHMPYPLVRKTPDNDFGASKFHVCLPVYLFAAKTPPDLLRRRAPT